jgi:glycosyltransferase involved in cell wall biosynthesis
VGRKPVGAPEENVGTEDVAEETGSNLARDGKQGGKAMLNGKKIVVVLPAYNAAKTLEMTYHEIPFEFVDDVVLVDDASRDDTAEVARRLGIRTIIHEQNKGYGGNQKTCYRTALDLGADIVIMLHPDYQYTPRLITAMAAMIAYGEFDAVLASRILGVGALKGGMPVYKYMANRFLTLVENILLGHKLSEYHTGYRAFSRVVLEKIPLAENSDDFVFDNQMLAQIIWCGFRIGELSCPTKYFEDASSINFRRSVVYGFGVLKTAVQFRLAKLGLVTCRFLSG